MSVAEMALSLYAANNGYFDKVDRLKVVETEAALSPSRALPTRICSRPSTQAGSVRRVEAALKKCCDEFFATL